MFDKMIISMDYFNEFNRIQTFFSKKIANEINKIKYFDSVKLTEHGPNDSEGYQIFTPNFVVQDMIKNIGSSKVANYETTILEPTSGDGAFTVRIMELRLKSIKQNTDYCIEVLRALSTLYSVEMDRDLLRIQRSNIFSTIVKDAEKRNEQLNEGFLQLIKLIISANYIWGMFNSDYPITPLLPEVAYSMPEAEKGKYKPIRFPVWTINENGIELHFDDIEV